MNQDQKKHLVMAATGARSNAYAPYSVYEVGAAALSDDGEVFDGCNVENASSGLTVCAERNAIAKMVASGRTRLAAIAVATRDGGAPCGACLQVMVEFAVSSEMPVVLVGVDGTSEETSLGALLPRAFSAKGLKRE